MWAPFSAHAQTHSAMDSHDEKKKPASVPVVDVAALMASASVAELAHKLRDPNGPLRDTVAAARAAASDWGVFYITNHGVTAAEVAAFRHASRRFFALPVRVKHRVRRRVDNSRGYFADELTSNRADRKEAIVLTGPHEDAAPRTTPGERLFANDQNQWLDDADLPGFQSTVAVFYAKLEHVARRVLMLFAVALGERIDYFDQFFHDTRELADAFAETLAFTERPPPSPPQASSTRAVRTNSSVLELQHYPAARDPEWTTCVRDCTDTSALTVVLQDDDGDADALQVFHSASQTWRMVPARRNTLVVRVGELLQLWSNDAFVAPMYRVLASEGASRYSAAFQYTPSFDAVVQPIVTAKDGAKPKYRPLHWLTYLCAKMIESSFASSASSSSDGDVSAYRIHDDGD